MFAAITEPTCLLHECKVENHNDIYDEFICFTEWIFKIGGRLNILLKIGLLKETFQISNVKIRDGM